MQDKYIFEYAVIRVVPKVEREEFVNVGLILFSKRLKFLKIQYQIPTHKIQCLCADFDIDQLEKNLAAFEKVCTDKTNRSPISQFEIDEKFRWITAVKSSSIQTSRPHPGYTVNINETFEALYQELVL
ncbi:DUF3037 domain-containing protein [Flavobacterium agricola]|uniref:DUF3037 domain-containing protein n=1 Tax=Flavobacterium agricola TaxID=2870839 RepID=A0ABY6M1G5_9FLAO|nr:DUF3037 domain-containing protein [Flavobacterium agricola]UYW00713.1 DUF3037 domain-containing protein [Flavobacterium agricola]